MTVGETYGSSSMRFGIRHRHRAASHRHTDRA
jgi:hypothetical protein